MIPGRLLTPIAVSSIMLGLSSGCGLFVGIDWDRVTVGDGGPGAGSGSGAGAGGPSGGDGGDLGDGGGAAGRDGGRGYDGGAGDGGGPVACTAPKVSCIAGCCDANDDPGLPVGISAGLTNSCAVTTTGKVRCWGSNIVGQLGRGAGADSATPTTAYHIPSGASSVAIGNAHGCAVVGNLFGCWGANGSGQVGFDATLTSLGLEEPGRVQSLQGTALSVSVGASHSCAVVDGAAYCWGSNDHGELAAPLSTYRSSIPLPVAQLGAGVVAIGAGGVRACAVVAGGGVSCWGGQGGDPPTPVTAAGGATKIAVAPFHACVLAGGQVGCWGSNLSGELGNDSLGSTTPVAPVGLPAVAVSQISANGSHTCAVIGGAAWCWGANGSGQLGRDTGLSNGLPAAVPGLSGVQAVAAGDDHTCALLAGNKLKCWGNNDEGQLGNGTKSGGFTPVDVSWP